MSSSTITQSKHKVNDQAGGSSAALQAQTAPDGQPLPSTHAGQPAPASPAAASDAAVPATLSASEPPAALFEDTPETAYLYALGQVRDIERQMVAETCYYRSGDRCLVTVGEVVQAILDGSLEVG